MLSQVYFILCGVNCILTLGKNEFLTLITVSLCVCIVYTLGEDLYSSICMCEIFYSGIFHLIPRAQTLLGRAHIRGGC